MLIFLAFFFFQKTIGFHQIEHSARKGNNVNSLESFCRSDCRQQCRQQLSTVGAQTDIIGDNLDCRLLFKLSPDYLPSGIFMFS